MKLQLASIFGEHMILQRHKPIHIFGRSAQNDQIMVRLADMEKSVSCKDGEWEVTFDAMEAAEKISLCVSSLLTDEKICFEDVAVGEVWLGGGQSNMEFLMRYDVELERTLKLNDDPLLRCYTAPQTAFIGSAEIDPFGLQGFWRCFTREEDRKNFSAVGAYMGMCLREKLHVPVGIISCNWGGSPACAWTAREDIENTPELRPILNWEENYMKEVDWPRYIPASEKRIIQSQEQLDFNERFMMGEDMSEFFKNFDPSLLPKVDFAPFNLGPRCVVRPAGLYENMLCKIAPYGIAGFMWYQGEDDDAREFQDFYDVSMATLIQSWRKLWKQDLPFYQIELAPFRGIGPTGAKKYDLMRHKQAEAASLLDDVYDICILDAGEEFNIHPRHKRIVGERLARSVLKHSYGDDSYIGESPRAVAIEKEGGEIIILFSNAGKGLEAKGDLKKYLLVKDNDVCLDYEYRLNNNRLILNGDFENKTLHIEYCEMNYCEAVLYNSDGEPAYGFTMEV